MNIKTIVLIIAMIVLMFLMFSVGLPFLLALIIAILLEPVVNWMTTKLRLHRALSATLVCSLFVVLLTLTLVFIGVKIYAESIEFASKVPSIMNEAEEFMKEALTGQGLLYQSFPEDWAGYIQSGLVVGVDSITDGLTRIISNFSGMVLDLAKTVPNMLIFSIVFLIALYLLSIGLPDLKHSFLSLFVEQSRHKMASVLDHLREAIIGFLKAQIFISFLTYIVAFIGLLFLGVGYPLAIALLIIIVDLLPILGTGSVLVPWAIYSFVTGDTRLAVGLIILFLVITIFRRIVEPKIVGDAVGISALAALVSLYVGLQLIGIAGLFLGPIIVILYQALKKAGLIHIRIQL
jgi:sporulation integral membrane protein YtvI